MAVPIERVLELFIVMQAEVVKENENFALLVDAFEVLCHRNKLLGTYAALGGLQVVQAPLGVDHAQDSDCVKTELVLVEHLCHVRFPPSLLENRSSRVHAFVEKHQNSFPT